MKGQRQPIRLFKVPFTAHWRHECVSRDVPVETRSGVPKTGDVWSVELLVNECIIVTGFGTSVAEAEKQCWELLECYAQPRLTNIRMAVKAVEAELPFTAVESLALVFAFCRSELGPQAYAGLIRNEERKAFGRPPTVDRVADLIARMVEGWRWLTGREIGFSEGGWITRAIEAVALYCALQTRNGEPYEELRDALRTEAPKYLNGVAVWSPTSITWPPTQHQEHPLTLD